MGSSDNEKLIMAACLVGGVIFGLVILYDYASNSAVAGIQVRQDGPPTQAVGFSVIRPVAWNFKGSGLGGRNTLYATEATIAFSNIAGVDLTVALNGSAKANHTIIKFSKPGAALCGWYGNIQVTDEVGSKTTVSWNNDYGYGKAPLPAGKQIVVQGLLTGPAGPSDVKYTCGGPSGGAYRWTITYQFALDQYSIQHSDAGTVTGSFQ